jgi:transposase
MIPLPSGVRVWLATGHTDMRKGFASLSLQVQQILHRDPLSGHLFCFRGRRGDLLKVIWHDGQGACLFSKRLERGRFLWPTPTDGVVVLSSAIMVLHLVALDKSFSDVVIVQGADRRLASLGPILEPSAQGFDPLRGESRVVSGFDQSFEHAFHQRMEHLPVFYGQVGPCESREECRGDDMRRCIPARITPFDVPVLPVALAGQLLGAALP